MTAALRLRNVSNRQLSIDLPATGVPGEIENKREEHGNNASLFSVSLSRKANKKKSQ
jgi:hypothetical protein